MDLLKNIESRRRLGLVGSQPEATKGKGAPRSGDTGGNRRFPTNILAKLVLLSLLVVLMAPVSVGAFNNNTQGYAESTAGRTSGAMEAPAADAAAPATPAPASNSEVIPGTFNVGELKADGQKIYVPSKADAAKIDDPTKSNGVVVLLLKVIDLFVKIIGSIALIVFILGAILTITSEGKEDRVEKGKTAMVYALIGLVITFFSFIIVAFVQSILF